MSDDDTLELLALCENISEDGELTYDELYKLVWGPVNRIVCFF